MNDSFPLVLDSHLEFNVRSDWVEHEVIPKRMNDWIKFTMSVYFHTILL